MIEHPQVPPESQPETTSPGVNIQDVEHDARPETRVDNAGVEVKPRPKKSGDEAREAESTFAADVVKLPPD